MIMSDIPFFLLIWLGFHLINSLEDEMGKKGRPSPVMLFLVLISVAYQFYTRPTAVVFLPAFVTYIIYSKKFKSGLVFLLFLTVLISPLYIRNYLVSKKVSYDLYEVSAMGLTGPIAHLKTMILNLDYYLKNTISKTMLILNIRIALLDGLIKALFIFFMLLGWGERVAKRRARFFDSYILYYIILHLLWPWQDHRYIFPVFPLLLFYFINGFQVLESIVRRIYLLRIPLFCLILLLFVPHTYAIIKKSLGLEKDFHPMPLRSYQWVKKNTVTESLFMAPFPGRLYVYTRRKSYGLPVSSTPEGLFQFMRKRGIQYVFLEPYGQTMKVTENSINIYKNRAEMVEHIIRQETFSELVYCNPHEKTFLYKILY